MRPKQNYRYISTSLRKADLVKLMFQSVAGWKLILLKNMQGELAAVIQEPTWTLPRLVNWLDMGIEHKDITKPSAIVFITGAVEALMNKGYSFEVLVRNKYDLRKALARLINELRMERENSNYNALFAANAQNFKTSSDLSIIFDEETYACNKPYNGGTNFNKHYTPLINDLNSSGEEYDCALHIDRMEEVEFWIRNADRKPNAFWLQLPDHKFYPDFVVKLKDGRIMIVEYKGADRYESEAPKRKIGDIWAEASNGQCLFCMPTNRDFQVINQLVAS
jgi:type III restriction enzyme